MRGIDFLRKHQVDFNTLTVVNNLNSQQPIQVYNFLKQIGSHYMQFIPIVERQANATPTNGLELVLPHFNGQAGVTPWSVTAQAYGQFLIAIFNQWVKTDVGRYYIQIIDATLANEVGQPSPVCVFNERCGNALAVEHNGDVYACDHYVHPDYYLGNLTQASLKKMLQLPQQIQFGNDKYDTLPQQCKTCSVYTYCRGECPKNRFLSTATHQPNLNYLCQGYKAFFNHVKPYMQFMANELYAHRPPANVMAWAKKRL
jgi:uncharacterized protein